MEKKTEVERKNEVIRTCRQANVALRLFKRVENIQNPVLRRTESNCDGGHRGAESGNFGTRRCNDSSQISRDDCIEKTS